MKNLKCLSTIIKDDLAVHIDLTDSASWNLNPALSATSISTWSQAVSEDIYLQDFGLTGFDNGRTRHLYDGYQLSANDTKLSLYQIGYNNPTGGTFFTLSGITAVTSGATPFVGKHYVMNGGFLQGFFKLEGFNHQTVPARFSKGFTMETIIRIDNNSFDGGFLFFFGTRAEDKYLPYFSGETKYEKGVFDGVYTSENNFLHSYSEIEEVKKAINNEKHRQTVLKINDGKDIYDNVFGVQLMANGALAFTRVNSKGLLERHISTKQITTTGWQIISVVFEPYENINDPDLLECLPNRKGDFYVYINGRLFWKLENFEEFFAKPLDNTRDKQIGVPYNISWGGGSLGLKDSYHYDYEIHNIYNNDTTAVIATAFTESYLSSNEQCVDNDALSAAYVPTLIFSADTTSFKETSCGIDTPITVMAIVQTGTTGTTRYKITYDQPLQLLSNRKYEFVLSVYDNGMFDLIRSTRNKIGLAFTSNVGITILEEQSYEGTLPFQWHDIRYVIKTEDNTGLENVTVSVTVESNVELYSGYTFYIRDFKYTGQDKLIQDSLKDNLMIERHFSKTFKGAIQKLRIYDAALSSQEILHNAIIEAENAAFGWNINKGGRIVYN